MPRPLSYVRSEILRVADELGVDPRSTEFSRTTFLAETSDVTKHDLEHYGGWTKLKQDAAHTQGISPSKNVVEARGVELRNLYVRGLERKVATTDYFADRLSQEMQKIFTDNPVKLSKSAYVKPTKTPPTTILNLLWSDLHFGVDVNNNEVHNATYSWTVAARRLSKLCEAAVNYDSTGTKRILRIYLNGDILHGIIHLNDSNIKLITEQVFGASTILIAALDFLRQHFQTIEVVCLPGNHDRTVYRDPGRSTSQRWDSYASLLYLSLAQAFRTDSHVKFTLPLSGMGIVDDGSGGLVIASHGDVEPDVGNVSKRINTDRLAVKLIKLRESLEVKVPVSVALFGHWHTPTVQMLPNGTWVIVNGSLIGTDTYGQNVVGEFNSEPAQVMFESIPGNPMHRIAIIKLKDADNNVSYDKIISPPEIFCNGALVLV